MDLEKFHFNTEFDHSETVHDVQSVTPKQLAQERERVRKQAYAEGYKKGGQDANANAIKAASDHMHVIEGQILKLHEQQQQMLDTIHNEVAEISHLVITRLFPDLIQNDAKEIVSEVVAQALNETTIERCVTIYVHKDLQPHVEHVVAQHCQNTTDALGEVHVKVGDFSAHADLHIDYGNRGLTLFAQRVVANIAQQLETLVDDARRLAHKENVEAVDGARDPEGREV